MPPVGFEPTISAGERPQTYALNLAVTGTGCLNITVQLIMCFNMMQGSPKLKDIKQFKI